MIDTVAPINNLSWTQNLVHPRLFFPFDAHFGR
jgi:hypothetical protein